MDADRSTEPPKAPAGADGRRAWCGCGEIVPAAEGLSGAQGDDAPAGWPGDGACIRMSMSS